MCKIGWLIKLKLMFNIIGFYGNVVLNMLKDINEYWGCLSWNLKRMSFWVFDL